LTSVFVSGDPNFVAMVERGLSERDMTVRPLAPQAIDARWNILDAASSPEYAAALGAALIGIRAGQPLSVNLIDPRKSQGGIALLPALARTLWPVAAMVTIALGGVGVVHWESRRYHALESELALLEPQQTVARLLRIRALKEKQEIAHLLRIAQLVRTQNWHQLSTTISQCMPEDVWLDDMRVDGQGRLQLVGASFTEDGVFEFVRWLEKLPGLEHVALSGTRPTRLDIGPATQFDVRCDFSGASTPKERNNGNG
jgi:Tfp pilus assembly protein PilN